MNETIINWIEDLKNDKNLYLLCKDGTVTVVTIVEFLIDIIDIVEVLHKKIIELEKQINS